MIYHTRDEQANHYTTDAVYAIDIPIILIKQSCQKGQ